MKKKRSMGSKVLRNRNYSSFGKFLFLLVVIVLLAFLTLFSFREFTGRQIQESPCTDADGDGYGVGCSSGSDCNDENSAIHPGATEVCGDGKDNDCDGFSYNTCYYVDGAKGNDANNGLSLSTAWKTIDKADSTLLAGDAVLIRAGTYNQNINPLNNGNQGNEIIYTNYNNEKATFTKTADFSGKSYIVIKGLDFFSTGSKWVNIQSVSHHLKFLNNYFNSSFDANDPSKSYTGIYMSSSSYITLAGNFFESWLGGDMVREDNSNHILFDGNDLSQNTATHASVHFTGTDLIIRNNYFHNPWERAITITRLGHQNGERALIENNVFVDNDWNRIDFHPIQLANQKGSGETLRYNVFKSILRNNIIIGHNLGKNYVYDGAIDFITYPTESGRNSTTFEKIRVYHNTLYRNRLNGITFERNTNLDPSSIATKDNKFKNNIISETENYSIRVGATGIDWRTYLFERNIISDTKKTNTVYIKDLTGAVRTVSSLENDFPNVFKSNIINQPTFFNERILDEADARPQNFRLKNLSDFFDAYTLTAASSGKNQGTHLASVTVSGTGTRIALDDALYFSDGFGLIDGDVLIIGDDVVKVIKIVDDTRIDVNRSITVQSGDKVYLALSGSSPDLGVYGIFEKSSPPPCTDIDGDGYGVGCSSGSDCNDENSAVHPGATEVCGNGIDENCDGADTPCSLSCTDNDGDRYNQSKVGCGVADCDDTAGSGFLIHPGAEEICGDGIDNDCFGGDSVCQSFNGTVVDNLDPGFSIQGTWTVSGGQSPYGVDSVYSRNSGDQALWSNSLGPGVYDVYAWWTYWPSRSQNAPYFIYNGNTLLDTVRVNQRDSSLEGKWNLLGEYTFDQAARVVLSVESNDSYNADAVGFIKVKDITGCTPSIEICDGNDNDCDGQIDENVKNTYYRDGDGDTYGNGSSLEACAPPADYVSNNLDCDDVNASVNLLKSCSYNEGACGTYSLCVASCLVPPPEDCTQPGDENCDGRADFCSSQLPALMITYPLEGKRYKNQLVPLKYSATNALNCWYTLNSGNTIDTPCFVDTSLDLLAGDYLLSAFANNSAGQDSETRNFKVQITRRYRLRGDSFIEQGSLGMLEDYTDEQLENTSMLSLELPGLGKIEWLDVVNLTQDANRVTLIIDLEGNINISFNRIEVKSDVMPSLNKKARITFYGLSFSNPRILRDGLVCYDCIIESYTSGALVFNVSGFSVYSAEETPSSLQQQPPAGGGGSPVQEGDRTQLFINKSTSVNKSTSGEQEEIDNTPETEDFEDLTPEELPERPSPNKKFQILVLALLGAGIVVAGIVILLFYFFFKRPDVEEVAAEEAV